MRIFGKDLNSKEKWSKGSVTNMKKIYKDGSSETKTYDSGNLINIRDTDSKGKFHDHKVGNGIFGPFKGNKK
ncbi:MAG: hypothetical protein WC899_08545 [bacterium]|jgi:hypothetical protein